MQNSYLCNRVRSILLGSRCVIMTRGRRPKVIIHIVSLIKCFASSCIQRFMQQRHRKFEIFTLFDTELHNSYFHNSVAKSKTFLAFFVKNVVCNSLINGFLGTRRVFSHSAYGLVWKFTRLVPKKPFITRLHK